MLLWVLQGQNKPGNSPVLSPPHLGEFSVDENSQEKIFFTYSLKPVQYGEAAVQAFL